MVMLACTGTSSDVVSSLDPVSIVGLSSKSSGELAGKPASIHLARRLCQVVARVVISCFISIDRLYHRAFLLTAMVDVVQGSRM